MADIKFSTLPAAAAAADADKLIGLQSGVAVNQTASALKTYMMGAPGAIGGTTPAAGTFTVLTAGTSAALTSPTFAAGSATAGSWPIHTPGSTLLTAAVAGAVEVDATNFYATTEAANRGVVGVDHFIIAAATRTFTSNTTAQAIFNSPSNGTLTLGTGTYLFDCLFSLDTMSATSGNGKFGLLGAGTATMGNMLYPIIGQDVAIDTNGAWAGIYTASALSSSARSFTAGTGTGCVVAARGSFVVTVAGTLIPSFTLETAASAVVKVGSYFTCRRIGSSSAVSVGNWS